MSVCVRHIVCHTTLTLISNLPSTVTNSPFLTVAAQKYLSTYLNVSHRFHLDFSDMQKLSIKKISTDSIPSLTKVL